MSSSAKDTKSLNFMTNYKFRIKSNLKIIIVITILHFLAAPVNLINLLIYGLQERAADHQAELYNEASYPDFNGWYIAIGILATIAAIICGFVVVFNIYNYLYKKQNVDMILSLPMSSKTRFWSDFSAGVTIYVAPFIVNSIISLILAGVIDIVFAEKLENRGIVNIIFGVSEEGGKIFTTFFDSLLPLILLGICVMLFLFAITLIITVCCGSLFETIAYSLGIHILAPLTVLGLGLLLFNDVYGIDIFREISGALEFSTPIGVIVGFGLKIISGGMSWLVLFKYLIIPFTFSVILTFGAYFLYIRRKAEYTGKPFVYKAFYYIIITCITLCIGSFMLGPLYSEIGGFAVIVPFIIITAIAYLIMELITNRGFKKFGKSVIKYLITIVSISLLVGICNITNGFGIEKYIPNPINIKDVKIVIQSSDNVYSSTLKGMDAAKLVTAVHKDIENDVGANYYTSVDIMLNYNKFTGGTVYRNYHDVKITPELMKEISDLCSSTDYSVGIIDEMRNALNNPFIYGHLIIDDFINFNNLYYDDNSAKSIVSFENNVSKELKEKNKKEALRFFDLLEKDIKAHDVNGVQVNTGNLVYAAGYTDESRTHSVYIYDDYVNVLEYLNSRGIKISDSEKYDIRQEKINSMFIFTPEMNNILISGRFASLNSLSYKYVINKINDKKAANELIKSLKPYILGDTSSYVISIGNILYTISEDKLNPIAAQIKELNNEFKRLAEKYNYMGGSGKIQMQFLPHAVFNNATEYGIIYSALIYAYKDLNGTVIYDTGNQEDVNLDFLNERYGTIYDINSHSYYFIDYESFCNVYKKIYESGYGLRQIEFENKNGEIIETIVYNDYKPILDFDRYNDHEVYSKDDNYSGIITADQIYYFHNYKSYCQIIDTISMNQVDYYEVYYDNDEFNTTFVYQIIYNNPEYNYSHYYDILETGNVNKVN